MVLGVGEDAFLSTVEAVQRLHYISREGKAVVISLMRELPGVGSVLFNTRPLSLTLFGLAPELG